MMLSNTAHTIDQILQAKAGQMFAEQNELEFPTQFRGTSIQILAHRLDFCEAANFCKNYHSKLESACLEWQQEKVEIFYAKSSQPFVIRPSLVRTKAMKNSPTLSQEVIGEWVFLSPSLLQLNKPLIEVLGRMIVNDRPMGLTRLSDQKQIWINQKFAEILETPPAEAVDREMSRFWLPADLAECNRRITQESRFTLNYKAALNQRTFAKLRGEIELVDDTYRLNTNLEVQPISLLATMNR